MAKRGQGKAKIITAAHQALLSAGRAGIRIDDVAQDAHINKRMIYHYFGDREGLIAEVLSRALALVLQDAETSEEMKRFLADRFRHVQVSDEAAPLENVSSAVRVLLTDVLYLERSVESEHSLTKSHTRVERRRLALEVAACLYPDDFGLDAEPKPVYRLQSESKRVGSNDS